MSELFLNAISGMNAGMKQAGAIIQQGQMQQVDAAWKNRELANKEELQADQLKTSQLIRSLRSDEATRATERFNQDKKGWTLEDKKNSIEAKALEIRGLSLDEQKAFFESPEGKKFREQTRSLESLLQDNQYNAATETSQLQKATSADRLQAGKQAAASSVSYAKGLQTRNPQMYQDMVDSGMLSEIEKGEEFTRIQSSILGASERTSKSERRKSSAVDGYDDDKDTSISLSALNTAMTANGKFLEDVNAKLATNPKLFETDPVLKKAYNDAMSSNALAIRQIRTTLEKGDARTAQIEADASIKTMATNADRLDALMKMANDKKDLYKKDDLKGKPAPTTEIPEILKPPIQGPQSAFGFESMKIEPSRTSESLSFKDQVAQGQRSSEQAAVQQRSERKISNSDAVSMASDLLNLKNGVNSKGVKYDIARIIRDEFGSGPVDKYELENFIKTRVR